MIRCSFRGCGQKASLTPQLLIDDNGSIVTIELQVKVCVQCADLPKRAFLSDDGRRHLTQLLHRIGTIVEGDVGLQFSSDSGVVIPWLDPLTNKPDTIYMRKVMRNAERERSIRKC